MTDLARIKADLDKAINGQFGGWTSAQDIGRILMKLIEYIEAQERKGERR